MVPSIHLTNPHSHPISGLRILTIDSAYSCGTFSGIHCNQPPATPTPKYYTRTSFEGACIDSGAQRSVIGFDQAVAYAQLVQRKWKHVEAPRRYRFGDGVRPSCGTIEVRIPLDRDSYLRLNVDIVHADIPLLVGLEFLREFQAVLNFRFGNCVFSATGHTFPFEYKFGHAFITWSTTVIHFTRRELLKMHQALYHPTATRLFKLIRRAQPSRATAQVLRDLQDVTRSCEPCQENSTGSHRFRVALPPPRIRFNHTVALDLMWLCKVPILHVVVDVQTHFQAAIVPKSKSAVDLWDAFIQCWAAVYTGFPTVMRVDHESSFVSETWRELAAANNIRLEYSGIESHNSLASGETYHSHLRRVFLVLRSAHPATDPETILAYATKGMNDTMGPQGITPSELVFGQRPSFPANGSLREPQRTRMAIIRAARAEMAQITAEDRIRRALKGKLPPNARITIKAGDLVRVYREDSRKWVGPFPVVRVERKQVTVNWDGTLRHFNLSTVMPVNIGDQFISALHSACASLGSHPPRQVMATDVLHPADSRARSGLFDSAIEAELRGLRDRGVFKVVKQQSLPQDANILGGRFVLSIKDHGTPQEKLKARYVVQGHTDADKNVLVHNTTTLRQASVRLVVSIAAILGYRLWSQDITQAYLQSDDTLVRPVYIRPNKHDRRYFNLADDEILLLLKPLYGLSDAGDYWYATLSSHLTNELDMVNCTGDLSLFFRRDGDSLSGVTGVYVDDQIHAGSPKFEEESRLTEQRFQSKPREYDNFKFAGIQIERHEDKYLCHQEDYTQNLHELAKDSDFSSVRSRRHALAWLTHTRVDLAADVNLLAQVTEAMFSRKHLLYLNKIIHRARAAPRRGIWHHNLDPESLHLRIYSDSSFANAANLHTQLGFIVCLSDASNRCNILTYTSYKSRRIVRSVLGGETYAFVDAFDTGFILRHDISRILNRDIPLRIFTDSLSLFNVIVKSTTTTERRLMIDI